MQPTVEHLAVDVAILPVTVQNQLIIVHSLPAIILVLHRLPTTLVLHRLPTTLVLHRLPTTLVLHRLPTTLVLHSLPTTPVLHSLPTTPVLHSLPTTPVLHSLPTTPVLHSLPTTPVLHSLPTTPVLHSLPTTPVLHSLPTTPVLHSLPTTPVLHSLPTTPVLHSLPTTPVLHSLPTTPVLHSLPTTPVLHSLPTQTDCNYSTTTGPMLRTVTCCTVRETVVSPHPALQPVSHWLCGVLPLSASSEAHTLLPSLRHSVLQALRTILPDPSLHSVSCGDIEDSVAGETATLVTFQSHSHRLSPTDPQRGGGGGVRGEGEDEEEKVGRGRGRRCGEREWTGADVSHLHGTSGHTGTAITCSIYHTSTYSGVTTDDLWNSFVDEMIRNASPFTPSASSPLTTTTTSASGSLPSRAVLEMSG